MMQYDSNISAPIARFFVYYSLDLLGRNYLTAKEPADNDIVTINLKAPRNCREFIIEYPNSNHYYYNLISQRVSKV